MQDCGRCSLNWEFTSHARDLKRSRSPPTSNGRTSFLRAERLPTVVQIGLSTARDPDADLPYPLVVKPRRGSCSAGVHVVHDYEELAFYLKRTEAPIVQRQALGREYTTNLLVGKTGQCHVAVPHWRIETRGGEVSKCVTVRQLRNCCSWQDQLAEALPDAYGPLCFQAFVDDQR